MYIKFYLHYAPLNITGIVTELKTEYFNDLEKCMERAEHLFQSGSQYVKVLREDGAIFCELEY